MSSIRQNITAIFLALLILVFGIGYLALRIGILRPLENAYAKNDGILKELSARQEGEKEFLSQISSYREGLAGLGLLLRARKDVQSGSDTENPYLVFDYSQVLQDFRRLLPRDSRVTRFQINNKGLITVPVETTSYSSLGRVLKSFKNSVIFSNIKIPTGVQRLPLPESTDSFTLPGVIYTMVVQATLNPAFWQNPIPFRDVDRLAYYFEAIRDLYIATAVKGYTEMEPTSDNKLRKVDYFRPDNPISRSDFFKILLFLSMHENKISTGQYDEFDDLSDEEWQAKYFQMAQRMGIAEADEGNNFNPYQTVTRREALKSILHLNELDPEPLFTTGPDGLPVPDLTPVPFTDVSPTSTEYLLVRLANDNHLLDNLGTEFRADQVASRAEVAYWVWKLQSEKLKSFLNKQGN